MEMSEKETVDTLSGEVEFRNVTAKYEAAAHRPHWKAGSPCKEAP